MITLFVAASISFSGVKLTRLPEYPNTPQPHPYNLSADGRTVVGQFAPGNAFLWRGAETAKFRPNPDQNVLDTYAQATSTDGSVIVGKAGNAYRWTRTSGFTNLGKFEGDIDSFAYDISGDGKVVVGYSQSRTSTRSFVWRASEGMIEIPAPEENKSSIALAISQNGKAACGISTDNSIVRAFRTDFFSSTLLPIGKIHTDSSASDISGDGSIIVGSVVSENGTSAVYWRNEQIYFLPNLGRREAAAKCISPDGTYIGGFVGDDAVLWHKQKGEKLQSIVNKPGWTFETVNGITRIGPKLVLTGWGAYRGKSVGYHLVLTQ